MKLFLVKLTNLVGTYLFNLASIISVKTHSIYSVIYGFLSPSRNIFSFYCKIYYQYYMLYYLIIVFINQ
jgi:hypothetical protein